MNVVTEPMPRHAEVQAACRQGPDCEWGDGYRVIVYTTVDGRNLRSRARRHVEATGHEMILHVETSKSTYFRLAATHPSKEETVVEP